MSRVYLAFIFLVLAISPAAFGQTFDASGNSLLNGTWFVRYVASDNLSSIGTVGRARSITGTIAFNGTGGFTLTGQVSDNTVNSGTAQALTYTGQYAVSASGLVELNNPLDSTLTIFGGLGKSALVGSSTENSNTLDMLVAVPVSSSVSNSSLQGQYWVGSLNYPGGDATQASNALFQINADGKGSLGTLSVSGHSVALANSDTTQTISGATYSLGSSGGTLTFPTGTNQLIAGTKQFAVSSDGNILIGGTINGYDIVVGVKAVSGSVGNAGLNGFFYSAGADSDVSEASAGNYAVDAYYGSIHATGNGTILIHQRINPSYSPAFDYTLDDEFTVGSNGNVLENADQFYVGTNGNTILVGRSTSYSIELSIAAETTNPTGAVVLNPLGIVNTANYAPITNPVAPGEFINLYGTGLAGSTQQAAVPLPTSLGGVSVTVNGINAPVYLVSSTEIVCIVPYGLNQPYATIQVNNNGTKSNAVTLFAEESAPGAFTLGQNGIGPGAFLHADGTVVSSSHPANVGEIVEAFLTGLGAVSPTVKDGAAASSSDLSYTSDQFLVYVDGTSATVNFAGLAPGFAGLYQVNFTVPSTTDTGEVYVDFEDNLYGGYTSMSTMSVSGVTAHAKPNSVHNRSLRYVHRESTCQESFGVTSASTTRAKCGSAGRTSKAGPSLLRRNAGMSPNGVSSLPSQSLSGLSQ